MNDRDINHTVREEAFRTNIVLTSCIAKHYYLTGDSSIIEFNDKWGRTFDEVVALLKEAEKVWAETNPDPDPEPEPEQPGDPTPDEPELRPVAELVNA